MACVPRRVPPHWPPRSAAAAPPEPAHAAAAPAALLGRPLQVLVQHHHRLPLPPGAASTQTTPLPAAHSAGARPAPQMPPQGCLHAAAAADRHTRRHEPSANCCITRACCCSATPAVPSNSLPSTRATLSCAPPRNSRACLQSWGAGAVAPRRRLAAPAPQTPAAPLPAGACRPPEAPAQLRAAAPAPRWRLGCGCRPAAAAAANRGQSRGGHQSARCRGGAGWGKAGQGRRSGWDSGISAGGSAASVMRCSQAGR